MAVVVHPNVRHVHRGVTRNAAFASDTPGQATRAKSANAMVVHIVDISNPYKILKLLSLPLRYIFAKALRR